MTLGQRIKEARIAKQMTQQEVVGDFITRNMLSQIENDSATPSVKTLEFLVSRLGLQSGALSESLLISPKPGDDRIERLENLMETGSGEFLSELDENRREWNLYGRKLQMLEAEHFLNGGEPKKAEAFLREYDIQDALFYFMSGELSIFSKNHQNALNFFKKAEKLGLSPARERMLYAKMEICHRELGDFEAAYACAVRQRAPNKGALTAL